MIGTKRSGISSLHTRVGTQDKEIGYQAARIHPTKGQDYIINTDAEGQYFTYSLDHQFDSLDQERSAWQLQYWGPIMDRSISIMKMNFCYGYGM